jgi:D-glycero-alpha-D-manno-heptose 1-phosphate guanylyltransferase
MVWRALALPPARSPAELDALVLCGGFGTRLRSAEPDGPKALARVAGRPFLEVLIESLARRGVRRFVLCAGYRADAIEAALPDLRRFGTVVLSREEQPLGTGGALRHALPHANRDPLLVVNGDSLCAADLSAMLAQHRERAAWLTLGAVPGSGRGDTGTLVVDARGMLLEFAEKRGAGSALTNAGIYLLESRALGPSVPPFRSFSLERELIPSLIPGRAHAFELAGPLLDIGTPERLRAAASLLREIAPDAASEVGGADHTRG